MKVSIIIIFDQIRKDKLLRLCESLKGQLDEETEVLFVHESKINSKVFPFVLPFSVDYFPVPEKQGIPFNRNQGIKKASGEVIVFIDDDCWVPENWLRNLLKPFSDENILAVTSGTRIPKSNFLGDCIAALGFPGGGSLGFSKVWKVSREGYTNHLAVGNCALRNKLFERIGVFEEKMKMGAEDTELSFRMEKAGILVKYVPEAYAYHEARDNFFSFVQWQIRRGRANYHFQQKVGRVGGFIKLRFWSAKNILKKNILNYKLPVILFLLGLSFILQQIGYLLERR